MIAKSSPSLCQAKPSVGSAIALLEGGIGGGGMDEVC